MRKNLPADIKRQIDTLIKKYKYTSDIDIKIRNIIINYII
jgi:hypothetical protein